MSKNAKFFFTVFTPCIVSVVAFAFCALKSIVVEPDSNSNAWMIATAIFFLASVLSAWRLKWWGDREQKKKMTEVPNLRIDWKYFLEEKRRGRKVW